MIIAHFDVCIAPLGPKPQRRYTFGVLGGTELFYLLFFFMKPIAYHLLSLAAFLALAFTATAVFAQEEASSTEETATNRPVDRQERRDEITEQINERRAEIQENVAERRAGLQANAQTRITNLAANLSNRFDAVTARLTNIADRLESRIIKLSDNGVDTTAASTELENARAAIDAAIEALSDIDALVNTAVSSENPREDWQNVKATYLTIRTHIIDARESLRSTVALLKDAVANRESGVGVSEAVENSNTEETSETSN